VSILIVPCKSTKPYTSSQEIRGEIKIKLQLINVSSGGGTRGFFAEEESTAHIEFLLFSYLSPTTAVLPVISFAAGVPTTTSSSLYHYTSTQLFCKPPERQ
jgi:hypothetical protein